MEKNTLPVVITDGYTRISVIDELPLIHGELTFMWRPVSSEKRAIYAELLKQKQGIRKDNKLMSEMIDKQIVSWSAGEKNVETIRGLQPIIWRRLADIILFGTEAPDREDPTWEASDKLVDDDSSLEDLLAKNSETESIS